MALLQLTVQLVKLFTMPIWALFLVTFATLVIYWPFFRKQKSVPVSVNYHFTRQCNKACGFCFHTAKTSHLIRLPDAKRGLTLLAREGMRKINFAGGEPFLYAQHLGEMLRFCKEGLKLESCSIVSNGSKITEAWLDQYGQYVDILAVSCDSFNEATNIAIGRGSGDNVTQLFKIANWCRKRSIKFKLNTVVCRHNHDEDMTASIERLQPFRWKCFQVLMVRGENDSAETLRDVRDFEITTEQFNKFCSRHAHLPGFVPEPNHLMAKSYLILDEYMRFLDREGREPSGSILDVGVQTALSQVFWDEKSFIERGGIYDWASIKQESGGCGSEQKDENLEW